MSSRRSARCTARSTANRCSPSGSSGSSSRAELARSLRGLLLEPAAAAELDAQGHRDAAVLVPLVQRDDGLHVVLTRRHADLALHPGEISFPGGRPEPGDGDLAATALREAHEEIGLAPADVVLAGALPPTPTMVTNYRIHPFIGLVEDSRDWRLEPREVDELLVLRLDAVRAGARLERLVRHGITLRAEVFVVGEAMIWGATARILGELLARLAPLFGEAGRPDHRPAPPPHRY